MKLFGIQSTDSKDERNGALHWAEVLSKEVVELKTLQQLKIVLGSQGKSWLSQFVDNGGLVNLLKLLAKDRWVLLFVFFSFFPAIMLRHSLFCLFKT